jgi:hypothetical protein
MRSVVLIIVAAHIAFFTGGLLADDRSATQNAVTRLKREYADVLALQGTAKGEILVIAKILRAKPRIAVSFQKDSRIHIMLMRWLIRQSQLLLMLSKSCPVEPQFLLVRSNIA